MEETASKRKREETHVEENCEEDSKRLKSYNHILSLLESEEEEPTQDLSSLITILQQELSNISECSHFDTLLSSPLKNDQSTPAIHLEDYNSSSASSSSSSSSSLISNKDSILKGYEEEEVDDKERVMRHLLEASDDELGIPNKGYSTGLVDHVEEDGFNVGGDGDRFCLGDGLWEFEDETANYYTLLQSELFL
ncbi:Zinc finger CCHC domain protein [Quillaja saponaria]|uniref:Zinc finger CCHC domain protein n=1 Tax=Quillaja saponaria TaxID=32244 RepID=A0AAD7P642_QUISA|nr:Zinc finger CCHC domain protein [Quillaja saponaria]